MPEDARGTQGLIGPNAVLQLLPVLERVEGRAGAAGMLARAGLRDVPDGSRMIPEGDAARLHHLLRAETGPRAPALAAEAGRRTADYILAHRIPRFVQIALRALPAPLAARALARAIAKHAWTFAGSGRFRVVSPWCFEIAHNPIIRGESSDTPLCHWHAAVFARLYQVLVHPRVQCDETHCAALGGAPVCRFELFYW